MASYIGEQVRAFDRRPAPDEGVPQAILLSEMRASGLGELTA